MQQSHHTYVSKVFVQYFDVVVQYLKCDELIVTLVYANREKQARISEVTNWFSLVSGP